MGEPVATRPAPLTSAFRTPKGTDMSNPPVDTTVITLEPVDYGAGPTDRVVYHDCKYRVDESGALHVFPRDDPDRTGNVASYAPGAWASVLRGTVVALGAPTHRHEPLRRVDGMSS
jgi:hypothetical protein